MTPRGGRARPLSVCWAGEGGRPPSVLAGAPSPATKLSLRCSASPTALAGIPAAMSAQLRPSADPGPPHPHRPGLAPSPPPAARAAQCTMHRCWGAAGRARTPRACGAPIGPLLPRPPPPAPHTRPPVSMATSTPPQPGPANKSMCLCLRLLSSGPALGHPLGPASRAGWSAPPKPNTDLVEARLFPPEPACSPGPHRGCRAASSCPPTVPDARSHLPLPLARAARPRQAPAPTLPALVAPCPWPRWAKGIWAEPARDGVRGWGCVWLPPDPGARPVHFLSTAFPNVSGGHPARNAGAGSWGTSLGPVRAAREGLTREDGGLLERDNGRPRPLRRAHIRTCTADPAAR